jgi:DNA-binding response OmpR family regulator
MTHLSLSALRVLVVEDEYLTAVDLCDELERAGAVVVGPYTRLEDALALLATMAPLDAAVLDVNLDGQPVFPLADALRRRTVPLIFTTGCERTAFPTAYTASRILEKPVRTSLVIDAVASEIRRDVRACNGDAA